MLCRASRESATLAMSPIPHGKTSRLKIRERALLHQAVFRAGERVVWLTGEPGRRTACAVQIPESGPGAFETGGGPAGSARAGLEASDHVLDRLFQPLLAHRLGQERIHADAQAALAVTLHRVRGQRDDRHVAAV